MSIPFPFKIFIMSLLLPNDSYFMEHIHVQHAQKSRMLLEFNHLVTSDEYKRELEVREAKKEAKENKNENGS